MTASWLEQFAKDVASCFTITTLYDIKQGRPHVIESLVDSAARPNAAIVFDFLNTTCNIQQHIAFVNVAGTSQVVGSTQTRVNEEEVKVAYKLAQSLAAARVAENDITVITPYKGQVVLFKHYADQVKMARTSVVMWNVPNVACSTIDEFQGRENSVMIVSLVNHEAVGFMADPRRQGIAFSRARDDLIIIGNHESRKNPWSRKYIGRSFLCSGTKSAGHGPTGELDQDLLQIQTLCNLDPDHVYIKDDLIDSTILDRALHLLTRQKLGLDKTQLHITVKIHRAERTTRSHKKYKTDKIGQNIW